MENAVFRNLYIFKLKLGEGVKLGANIGFVWKPIPNFLIAVHWSTGKSRYTAKLLTPIHELASDFKQEQKLCDDGAFGWFRDLHDDGITALTFHM